MQEFALQIGIPQEFQEDENRVALTPAAVHVLVQEGHDVCVEAGAGLGSGISDREYEEAGALVVKNHDIPFDCELVVKVKQPTDSELPLCRPGQVLFAYFHLAAQRQLTEALLKTGATCIAYETVRDVDGSLPLLTPMSEIAGRMAILQGARYLEKSTMGRGLLLGGVPGVERGDVVILGGGVVGANAAKAAAGLGARVTVLDIDLKRLRHLAEVLPPNVTTLHSTPYSVRESVLRADLVIGAVLVPGSRTPRLLSREILDQMKDGAVLVDVAVDQGGCSESSRPTTHSSPSYVAHGVIHYCVANMPGSVGRTSTHALSNATLDYVRLLARLGVRQALETQPSLLAGANIVHGQLTCPGVASAFGMEAQDPLEVLSG